MDIRPGLKLALFALAVAASVDGVAATASVSCEVVEPVSVTKSAALASGKFAAGAGAPALTLTRGAQADQVSVIVEYN